MGTDKKTPLSLLQKMKEKAREQKTYGGTSAETSAKIDAVTCRGCGAGRAQQDGLTHCAYCGFAFLSVTLSDGIHIKKEDNSENR